MGAFGSTPYAIGYVDSGEGLQVHTHRHPDSTSKVAQLFDFHTANMSRKGLVCCIARGVSQDQPTHVGSHQELCLQCKVIEG